MSSKIGRRVRFSLLTIITATVLTACQQQEGEFPVAPIEVSVEKTAFSEVAIADDLPGRVAAFRVAEIRPQVNGIIQKRLFEQGSEVRAGQPLFQIEAAPFVADAQSAAAAVKRAHVVLQRAKEHEQRLAQLVKEDAISGQAYDDAVAARAQAEAELAESRATLRRREVDVAFATIRSPIAGRIDQAVLTEGALASVGSIDPLATVQQIDRVYVDVRQPAARLEQLREAARAGQASSAEVKIISSAGRPYPVTGKLLFSGISVDPGTGEVISRIEVPNPDRALLPGMFVRARLPRMTLPNAITVPAQAVARDAKGSAMVSLVDQGGKVTVRPVTAGEDHGGRIVIEKGLEVGELVIVEGQDRVSPGAVVQPMPWRPLADNL